MTARLKGTPVTVADVSDSWIQERREIIVREGYALRPGLDLTIEVKSLTTNEWLPLTLPGDTIRFVSSAERDAVLRRLQGNEKLTDGADKNV